MFIRYNVYRVSHLCLACLHANICSFTINTNYIWGWWECRRIININIWTRFQDSPCSSFYQTAAASMAHRNIQNTGDFYCEGERIINIYTWTRSNQRQIIKPLIESSVSHKFLIFFTSYSAIWQVLPHSDKNSINKHYKARKGKKTPTERERVKESGITWAARGSYQLRNVNK